MRRFTLLVAAICLLLVPHADADQLIASVQQKLKDQGFYYGAITGQKDADTTAAIRRFQIRNGLQINGELNAETQKSLGVRGNVAPAPTATPSRAATPPPRVATPPPRVPSPAPPPDTSDLRDEEDDDSPQIAPNGRPRDPAVGGYAPGPRGLAPETTGVFDGTPYEVAPPDVQRRVLIGAQTLLARRGYYRSMIDGVYGPGMAFAVRAFQSRFALEPSGRLDMQTLAALGLLPGQQAPGVTAPRRRVLRRSNGFAPNGEPIYIPR
jgi:peptidoglycan hydrolase-like protein with peptidoglycan-binding domain